MPLIRGLEGKVRVGSRLPFGTTSVPKETLPVHGEQREEKEYAKALKLRQRAKKEWKMGSTKRWSWCRATLFMVNSRGPYDDIKSLN